MTDGRDPFWWRRMLSGGDDSRRLLLALLVGVLAVQIGFVAVQAPLASCLIAFGGYYFVLGVTVALVITGWRLACERREVIQGWIRNPGWAGLALLIGSVVLISAEHFGHKILFDDYVLQSTSQHMHLTKQVGTPYRGYFIEGTFVSFDVFLDKRPYFFVFLVSLVHDLTGYRPLNMMVVNASLVPVLLGLVYYLGRSLSGKRGGILAVALMATIPLLGQNATGAGMEIHNLTMLALTMCAGLLYLRKPDNRRLTFLCLSTVLLSQSRYESVIFAVPVAAIVLVGWNKLQRPLLPWTALATPLLFVPYAWHNRVLSASPLLWQLNEGQSSRFSTEYLPGNLEGLGRFFFHFGKQMSNSWLLSLLGLFSLLTLLVLVWFRGRRLRLHEIKSEYLCFAAFALGVAANLGVLMFYYWARLDDPVASRFSLPSYLILALCSVLAIAELAKRWDSVWRIAAAALGLYLIVSGIPMRAYRLYSEYNLLRKVIDWEQETVDALPRKPRLIIDDRSNLPWLLRHIPAVVIDVTRYHAAQIKYHMEEGTFQEVLVVQILRPSSAQGDYAVDYREVIPMNYHLEVIAEKRFGPNIHRISRIAALTDVEPRVDSWEEN